MVKPQRPHTHKSHRSQAGKQKKTKHSPKIALHVVMIGSPYQDMVLQRRTSTAWIRSCAPCVANRSVQRVERRPGDFLLGDVAFCQLLVDLGNH